MSNKFLLDFFCNLCRRHMPYSKVLVVCLKFVLLLVSIARSHTHIYISIECMSVIHTHSASWTESHFQSRSIETWLVLYSRNTFDTLFNVSVIAERFVSIAFAHSLILSLTHTDTNFYTKKILVPHFIHKIRFYIYIYIFHYKNSVCISC